jgi:hypothetical protein
LWREIEWEDGLSMMKKWLGVETYNVKKSYWIMYLVV